MLRKRGLNVLIFTIRNDMHADVVAQALIQRGHHVLRWLGNDFPVNASATIEYRKGKVTSTFRSQECTFKGDHVDVIWNRRRLAPTAPKFINTLDKQFTTYQLRAACDSIDASLENAFWINNYSSQVAADCKVLQLSLANDVGFTIPSTLISNDPNDIKEFIESVDECIYKTFDGYVWHEHLTTFSTYTASVDLDVLPSNRILQSTPGIYQDKIAKSYEVRVQFFGAFYAAVRIESGKLNGGDIDWRIDQKAIRSCVAVILPSEVYRKCRMMMNNIGIVSAAFDFIVGSDDDWVFLEINEAGQFLFLETWCRELHVLDAFCQFVESSSADFEYLPSDRPVVFQAFPRGPQGIAE